MEIGDYHCKDAFHNESHSYLLPAVTEIIDQVALTGTNRRIFDLGCGSGSVAAHFASLCFDVVGVDPSAEGIQHANQAYPELKLYEGSAYDDLAGKYGQFPVVISLEVVEHVYFPREYAACLYSLLEGQGTAIISTPYHGYWKNLALALTGKLDAHFTVLWDHGHIKFWSCQTLDFLLREAGFKEVSFARVGRIPPLAKSMIAIARK